MPRYVFPGYPAFLEAAAAGLGHPEAVDPARRIAPLISLANLCAQAAHGDASRAPAILAKAAGFRDQLAVALDAANRMLEAVDAGRAEPEPPVEESPAPPPPGPSPAGKPSRGRS